MQMRLEVSKSIAVGLILLLATVAGSSFARDKAETIDATAMGTSTQMGRVGTVRIIIYEYSTPEDRQILVEAFQKGQSNGLANALGKMKAVGRIQIPGTVGYDLSFIRDIPTPTGRKIRFITNRKIAFSESYWDTQSKSFNLTAGEINIDKDNKDKSAGVLYPATQLVINKDGEPQFDLNQNPWKLTNIIDWQGTPGTN
jgi:hypothetical protein